MWISPPMLDHYIGECMVSRHKINNDTKEPTIWPLSKSWYRTWFLILGGYHWVGVPTKCQHWNMGSIIGVRRFLHDIWMWKGITKIKTRDPMKTSKSTTLTCGYTKLILKKHWHQSINNHHLRVCPNAIGNHCCSDSWGWNWGIKSKQGCPDAYQVQ